MGDNMTITNFDMGGIVIGDPVYDDGLLKFTGEDEFAVGTILAKQVVAAAIVVTPGSNTGNGTVTASVAAGDIIPLPGNYNLECTFAVANGGVFKLEDPNGNIVADNITLRVGDGLVTTVVAGGIKMVITEGDTQNFVAGDSFAIAVVADGDWVPLDVDGVGGAQKPRGILTVAESATEASDVSFRPLIGGRIRREKLVIDGGDTVTDRIVDQLRDVGFVIDKVTELNMLDNQ